ncbi:MAG: hypothetical protein AB1714_10350 [Acidobacteriota bacterium]
MMNERRRAERVKVEIPVRVTGFDAAGQPYEVRGRAVELSLATSQLAVQNTESPRDLAAHALQVPRHMAR